MNLEEKLSLITRNVQEILTMDELKALLNEKQSPSAYYGTAPTGPVHLGYFIPLSKVLDFTKVGIKTKILLADIHSALDDQKTKWDEIDAKVEYYKKCIELSFPWGENKPEFVRGSDYQMNRDYVLDVLKLSTMTTVSRATRAASEVTRMKNPKVSELIYPIMQALDEEYLDVDIQIGGIDQRHIMALAREYLPKLNYKKRVEIMTPLIVSLQGPGKKMSASIPMSHIKVYDSEEAIKNKLNKAYCPEGVVEDNPVLQIAKFLVFPAFEKFEVHRPEKFGGDVTFNTYDELENAFVNKKLHPVDLKNTLAEYLIKLFKPSRDYFESNTDLLKQLGEEFMP